MPPKKQAEISLRRSRQSSTPSERNREIERRDRSRGTAAERYDPSAKRSSAESGKSGSRHPESNPEERARIRSITELCGEFGMEARSYIESGATLDSVREAALEHVRQHGAPIAANGRVSITESAEDKFRAAAADAIVMRSGMELQNPADGARQMMGMTLRDLAIECLTNEGQSDLTEDPLMSSTVCYRDSSTIRQQRSLLSSTMPSTRHMWKDTRL